MDPDHELRQEVLGQKSKMSEQDSNIVTFRTSRRSSWSKKAVLSFWDQIVEIWLFFSGFDHCVKWFPYSQVSVHSIVRDRKRAKRVKKVMQVLLLAVGALF